MCKKFVLASDTQRIETRFNARIESDIPRIPKLYAISCGEGSYVITSQDPHLIRVFKFGMNPFFADEPLNLINARVEGDKNSDNNPRYNGSKAIFLQRAFRKPIQSQRCLVIADAYYEWSDRDKPYLVYLQNKIRPFAFAGLYDQWQDPQSEEVVFSFAIITTTSNPLLQSLGVKRMPVILSRSNESHWIKASNHLADVLRLLVPFPYEKMNAYPVAESVNMPDFNDPFMLNPIGKRLRAEINPTPLVNHRLHKEKPPPDKLWFQGH
jgi:putative SOS response-associated peptidase YedK